MAKVLAFPTDVNKKLPDLKHIEEIMERTKSALETTYQTGSEATKFFAESARNELIRDSLDVAKEALRLIKQYKLTEETSASEIRKIYASMIASANTMIEHFKEAETERLDQMTDEDLAKEATEGA